MDLDQLGNLVINRKNNQYSITIRTKQLNKLNIRPQQLMKAKIDFFGIKK